MISFSQLLNEGALEKAAEDFLRQTIKGTEWDGKIFVAGGYVRDELLGKDPKDLDIMVDAPNGGIDFANWITQKIGAYSDGNPVVFPRFGTAKFNLRGVVHNGIDLSEMDIESVMPRQETYVPGSRKPEVQFTNLKGDAERRDLSINAMYKNISTGEYLDPTGLGMNDLKSGILRTPIDPNKTFTDDPLRMLRLVRFFAKYGYKFAPNLLKSLKRNANQLENISKERIQEELNKMLMTTRPEKAMKLLKLTGLMDYVIPEFRDAYNMTQNVHHNETVFDHILTVLSKTRPSLIARIGSLLHDIGKVATKEIIKGEVHFYSHENAGADMAEKILTRLKYPKKIIDAVVYLIKNHMRLKHSGKYGEKLTNKSLRKFVKDMEDHLEDMMDIIHADNRSHNINSNLPDQIPSLIKRIDQLKSSIPKKNEKLPITGDDLKKIGLKPGPLFKELLDLVKDRQLENPNTTKEEYLDMIRSHIDDKNV